MSMQTDELGPDTPRNRGDYSAPHISPVTPGEDIRTILINRGSGTAILVGTAMILAFQLVLNLLGVGIGAANAESFTSIAQAATDMSGPALLWWAGSGIVAAFIGGLAAGRLSGQPKPSSAGWHGLGAWAVSLVVVAILMTGVIGSVGAAAQSPSFRASMNAAPGSTTSAPTYNNNGTTGSPAGVMGPPAGTPEPTGANAAAPESAPAAIDAKTAAQVSIISAIALLIGAFAAWLGGLAGAVKPTVTDLDLRSSSFHSL